MKYKKTIVLFLVCLIIIPPVVFALSVLFPNDPISKKITPVFKKIERNIENPLSSIARDSLLDGKGEYGIYVKNLKTGEEFSYQKNKKFDSASLYKLWVMAVVFQKIKDGNIDEDQELSASIKKLDDILLLATPTPLPEGSPSLTPEKEEIISMKTSDALFKMITISDNYAALLLASKSGNLNIANYIKKSGFSNSNFLQPPQTSAGDVGKFYEMLYKEEIIDSVYSEKMINLLKQQVLNDRIPKYLPSEIEIAHKTGELLGSKHDAGIVYGEKGDYIIVVLTDTEDPADAAERIAKFSEGVYEYFENQK